MRLSATAFWLSKLHRVKVTHAMRLYANKAPSFRLRVSKYPVPGGPHYLCPDFLLRNACPPSHPVPELSPPSTPHFIQHALTFWQLSATRLADFSHQPVDNWLSTDIP